MNKDLACKQIGVPVRAVNWVWLMAGENCEGSPCLYATMGQFEPNPLFVCQIDIQTGACRRFDAAVPLSNFPTAAFWSRRHKRAFVGGAFAGHLFQFDPRKEALEDLGAIHPEKASFPCQIDEAPDGSLYIGSWSVCDLTRYRPETGEFIHYGRMDDTDQYFYVACGADGTVAGCVRVAHPHVVALDPQTGAHRAIGPVADTDSKEGFVELIKGEDGLLYIRSHAGCYRLQGLEAIPVAQIPLPSPTFDVSLSSTQPLPDGSTYRFLDRHTGEHRQIEIIPPLGGKPSAFPRVIYLDWEADGSGLMLVRPGPDGKVYGSSALPEHLFSYDPSSETLTNHGACAMTQGEAYAIEHLDGRLYIASYTHAYLSVYDPAKPYRFGSDKHANPRHLGRMDDVAYRPRTMLAGPAGKIWVGSVPDYGMWGGTLAWYDPRSGTFGSHRHLMQDCTPYSLAWFPELDRILVGLSTESGTGTTPRAARAGFILWDPVADRPTWQGDFGLPIQAVHDLYAIGDGRAYALIQPADPALRMELLLLDMKTCAILSRAVLEERFGSPAPLVVTSFFRYHDWLYGATDKGLYRVRLGSTVFEWVWDAVAAGAPPPTKPGAQVGARWYFVSGTRLMALDLPQN